MNPGILKVIFIQIAYVPSHHILTQRVSLLEDTHTKSHNLTPGNRRLSVIRECCSCWTNIFLYFTFWLLLFCRCFIRIRLDCQSIHNIIQVLQLTASWLFLVTTVMHLSTVTILAEHIYLKSHLTFSDTVTWWSLSNYITLGKKTVLNCSFSICHKLGVRMGVVVAQ